MRDDAWLLSRLNDIWEKHFLEVEQRNPVTIAFGRRAKYRFGSVQLKVRSGLFAFAQNDKKQRTHITINGLFRKETIPQAVVDYTIAHELVHYVHGFSSPLPRKLKNPHKGGVVKNELIARGLGHLHTAYRAWLKEYRLRLNSKLLL